MKLIFAIALLSMSSCATYEAVKPKVLAHLHGVCEALPEVEAMLDKAESVIQPSATSP